MAKKSPKRSFKFSPIRWLGKSGLKNRSDTYNKAMIFVDKSDDLIRDSVLNQKKLLKEMESSKKKLAGALFAEQVEDFIKEQKAVVEIIKKMKQTFDMIAAPYGNINLAINAELLKSPEVEDKEKLSEEDYIASITEQLDAILAPTKEAFLSGYYWRTRTESGKKLAAAFSVVLNKFNYVFEKNLSILKELDEIRDKGDPQEYLNKASKNGFIPIGAFISKSKDLSDAINNYFSKSLYAKPVAKQEEFAIAPDESVTEPTEQVEQPKQEPAPIETKTETPSVEQVKSPTVETTVTEEQLPTEPQTVIETEGVDVTEPEKPKSNLDIAEELVKATEPSYLALPSGEPGPDDELEKALKELKEKDASFVNQITKLSKQDNSEQQIISLILKHSEYVEPFNKQYSLKLIAIAEGMLDA